MFLLQELICLKEQLGPEGRLGGLLDVVLQASCQRPREQGYHEHDGHSDQVVWGAEPEGEPGNGEEEVEHQHADHRGQQSAQWALW